MFIEILFKMLLFKGGVLIYAEHCIWLRHLCAIIMLSNQHLDIPHHGKAEVLTNTDLDRFVNNI